MSFDEVIVTCFSKYATFSGRAGRPEYWYWVLFTFAVGLTLQFIGRLAGIGATLAVFFDLAVLMPAIAVGVRRLHDTDHSAWNLLWSLTLVGIAYLLYLYLQPTQEVSNTYGWPPLTIA